MGELLRGRKEIMAFLKIKTWKTVQKYRKEYGMPVLIWPNRRPVAIPAELLLWVSKFNEIVKKRGLK